MAITHRLAKMEIRRTSKEAASLRRKTGLSLGENNPNWKGGKNYRSDGYVRIRMLEHPRAINGYVVEHILVWEKVHNRPLPKGFIVHHINAVKDDNRPRNLIALPKKGHSPTILLRETQAKIRELEAENGQLIKALESNRMVFHISEN